MENLHLDQRFCLSFVTTLTWSADGNSNQNGISQVKASQAAQQYGKGCIKVRLSPSSHLLHMSCHVLCLMNVGDQRHHDAVE